MVLLGDRFRCSTNLGDLQTGTTGRYLVFRDFLENSMSICVFRYTFPGCAHISGTYSSASVVFRDVTLVLITMKGMSLKLGVV